jgi:uncharacterized protein
LTSGGRREETKESEMSNGETKARSIEDLMRAHVRYMVANPDKWMEFLSDDVTFEFPYGEAVGAKTLSGKQAIVEALSPFVAAFEHLELGEPKLFSLRDETQGFCEFDGTGTVKGSGRKYSQHYLTHIQCHGGKITHIKEYFDPYQVLRAFGKGE